MSPFNLRNFTTNDNYGGFYESPRISLHLIPKRIKNDHLENKQSALFTSNAEYGGFLNIPRSSLSPKWIPPERQSYQRIPGPPKGSFASVEEFASIRSPRFHTHEAESPREDVLRFNDRVIHLPEVDTIELHMKDKSKILLSVKEFYRRYLDV